jgi:hypothetical protein
VWFAGVAGVEVAQESPRCYALDPLARAHSGDRRISIQAYSLIGEQTVADLLSKPCTAFEGPNRIAQGALVDVALAAKAIIDHNPAAAVLTFDDVTGGIVDLDLRGTTAEIVSRLTERSKVLYRGDRSERRSEPGNETSPSMRGRGRGRPKLGVIGRDVSLLPRHWEWLSAQSGGASAALRLLVDEARRGDGGQSRAPAAREAAYRFMSALAGDFTGFEEATRALFADDHSRFTEHTATWPPDIRSYAEKLAWGETAEQEARQPTR